MDFSVDEGNPLSDLDQLLTLFERAGKPRSAEWFQWYYEDKGLGPPSSWMLRDRRSGRLAGLLSVVWRQVTFDDQRFRAGLIGNLLVDSDYRGGASTHYLSRIFAGFKASGCDFLLAIKPNASAGKVARYHEFRSIGAWQKWGRINRSGKWLRHRYGLAAAAAGPFVDFAAAIRRQLTVRPDPHASGDFDARILDVDEVKAMRPSEWAPPNDQFAGECTADLLQRQFLTYPDTIHEFFGIYPAGSSKSIGVVVVAVDESIGRADIRYAAADTRHASSLQAIFTVLRVAGRRYPIWRAAAIEGSAFEDQIRNAGFVQHPRANKSFIPRFMVYSDRKHPLSKKLRRPENWSMFQGFNDV